MSTKISISEFFKRQKEDMDNYLIKVINIDKYLAAKQAKDRTSEFSEQELSVSIIEASTWVKSLNFGSIFDNRWTENVYENEHLDFLSSFHKSYLINITDVNYSEYLDFVTESLLNNPLNPIEMYDKETNEFTTHNELSNINNEKDLDELYDQIYALLRSRPYLVFLFTVSLIELKFDPSIVT